MILVWERSCCYRDAGRGEALPRLMGKGPCLSALFYLSLHPSSQYQTIKGPGRVKEGRSLTCQAKSHRPNRDSTFGAQIPMLSSAYRLLDQRTFKVALHGEVRLESLDFTQLTTEKQLLEFITKRMESCPDSSADQLMRDSYVTKLTPPKVSSVSWQEPSNRPIRQDQ
jgi:hypothetical protein